MFNSVKFESQQIYSFFVTNVVIPSHKEIFFLLYTDVARKKRIQKFEKNLYNGCKRHIFCLYKVFSVIITIQNSGTECWRVLYLGHLISINHIISTSVFPNWILFQPLLRGEELYTQMGFFLFRQFEPIDIFIVESCEWYDLKARSAHNMELKRFFLFSFFTWIYRGLNFWEK